MSKLGFNDIKLRDILFTLRPYYLKVHLEIIGENKSYFDYMKQMNLIFEKYADYYVVDIYAKEGVHQIWLGLMKEKKNEG